MPGEEFIRPMSTQIQLVADFASSQLLFLYLKSIDSRAGVFIFKGQ